MTKAVFAMVRMTLAVTPVMLAVMPVLAQEEAPPPPPPPHPEIIIGTPPPQPGEPQAGTAANAQAGGKRLERCVDVVIGGARSFDCLNQKLRQQVDNVNPVTNTPPLDARSPDVKVGVVNIPAVQEQYGRNFGVSVVPFRPPQVFTPPLGHR